MSKRIKRKTLLITALLLLLTLFSLGARQPSWELDGGPAGWKVRVTGPSSLSGLLAPLGIWMGCDVTVRQFSPITRELKDIWTGRQTRNQSKIFEDWLKVVALIRDDQGTKFAIIAEPSTSICTRQLQSFTFRNGRLEPDPHFEPYWIVKAMRGEVGKRVLASDQDTVAKISNDVAEGYADTWWD